MKSVNWCFVRGNKRVGIEPSSTIAKRVASPAALVFALFATIALSGCGGGGTGGTGGIGGGSTTSTMNWKMQTASNCSKPVYWRVFDQTSNQIWPSSTQVYVLNQSGVTDSLNITCTNGDTVVFGASESSSSDSPYYWGAGINFTETCTNCAYKCSAVTVPITFSCSN